MISHIRCLLSISITTNRKGVLYMNCTEIVKLISQYWPSVAPIVNPAIGSVVGGLMTAIFLRRNTATSEFEKIKAGKINEVVDDLLATGNMTYTEFYKAKNFLDIAQKADQLYSGIPSQNPPQNDSCVEFDWLVRFYEAAGNISDDQVQELWAKVLAGEVRCPSSYSLQAIDTLRNLGKNDILLFNKVCAHSFYDGDAIGLLYDDTFMQTNLISYSDIMHLSEHGLIYYKSITRQMQITTTPQRIFYNNSYYLTAKLNNEGTEWLRIEQYPFTSVGCELAKLSDKSPTIADFIYMQNFLSKDHDYSIGLYHTP